MIKIKRIEANALITGETPNLIDATKNKERV